MVEYSKTTSIFENFYSRKLTRYYPDLDNTNVVFIKEEYRDYLQFSISFSPVI